MEQATAIGLDLAKSVFQVHGIAASGKVVLRRTSRRGEVPGFFAARPLATVDMEACGGAHYWARELARPRGPAHATGLGEAGLGEAVCQARQD